VVEAAGDQEHPEPVVVAVAVAAGDAPVQLDDPVESRTPDTAVRCGVGLLA